MGEGRRGAGGLGEGAFGAPPLSTKLGDLGSMFTPGGGDRLAEGRSPARANEYGGVPAATASAGGRKSRTEDNVPPYPGRVKCRDSRNLGVTRGVPVARPARGGCAPGRPGDSLRREVGIGLVGHFRRRTFALPVRVGRGRRGGRGAGYSTTARQGLAHWPAVVAELRKRSYRGPGCLTAELNCQKAEPAGE
jgi:hypothetical protein